MCLSVSVFVCVLCVSPCVPHAIPSPPPPPTQDSLKTVVMRKDTSLFEAHLSASKVLRDNLTVQVSKGVGGSPRRMWIGSLVTHK